MKTQSLSTDDKLTTNLDCIETKFIIIYHIFFSGRTYGPDKKIKRKIKQDIVPPMNKKIPLIGGDNIGLDRRQDNRNLQNGGNWGNRDFLNQRQNGGFLDNIQNLDILNQGSRRFQNRDILNQGPRRFQNRDIINQGQGLFQNQDILNQGQGALLNDRFVDRFNGNSRQNQQFGNQW